MAVTASGNELVQLDMSDMQRLLRQLEGRGKHLAPVLPAIADILVTAVEDQFDSEGQGRWPPLAASTVAGRRMGGAGHKILQDTGVLAGSVRPDHGSDWAAAATDVSYAIFHVSSAPRKKIPKRDFLAVDTEDTLREVEDVLVAYLVGSF